MRRFVSFGLSLVALGLISCGDESKLYSSSQQSDSGVLTGQFVDAPVQGLEYSTNSGITGITDENGYFNYREGDKITFRIGNMFLGTTNADKVITPSSLFEGTDITLISTKEKILQITSMLYYLDDNPDDTTITISDEVRNKLYELPNDIDLSLTQYFITTDTNCDLDNAPENCINGNVLIDINNDGIDENIILEAVKNAREAWRNYVLNLESIVKNSLENINGSKFMITLKNLKLPRCDGSCTLNFDKDTNLITMENCDENLYIFSNQSYQLQTDINIGGDGVYIDVGIERGSRLISINGYDEGACFYYAQSGRVLCIEKYEPSDKCLGTYPLIATGYVNTGVDLSEVRNLRVDITPTNIDKGIVCEGQMDIEDPNGVLFGENCVLYATQDDFTDATCHLTVFEDVNENWELDENDRILYEEDNECIYYSAT